MNYTTTMMTCVFIVMQVFQLLVSAQGPDSNPTTTSSNYCNTTYGDDATYTESLLQATDANGGYIRRIVSTGCPNYPTSPVGDNTNDATVQDKDYPIMAYPCFSNMSDYDLTCTGGDVGITLNGISILSMFPGTCGSDAVELEGDTFDSCSGHSSESGNYHYHVTPSCLLDQMGDYYNVTEHSPQIGWAFDGFPVYGPHGPGGDLIYPCNHSLANASSCLDDCGGTEQYIIDGFLYHYHIVGPIGDLVSSPVDPLPNTSMVPYTIGCFKGVVYDWSILQDTDNGASCESNGYDDSYTATVTEGVTAIYGTTTTTTATPTMDPSTSSPSTYAPTADPVTPTTSSPTTKPPTSSPSASTASPTSDPVAPTSEPSTTPTSDPVAPTTEPSTSTTDNEVNVAEATESVDQDLSKGVMSGGIWGWTAMLVGGWLLFI